MSEQDRFARLFAGLDRSHGRYVVPAGAKANGDGKLHDRTWARTVTAPVARELWAAHLECREGLGIVPIRDSGDANFGALDIDTYPLDLPALAAKAAELKLPLIVCRTKSGGAHLYVFLTAPLPARELRGWLAKCAAALGFAGCEVFPKQDRLAGEDDHGSWINLPYYGGDRSTRYALGPDGRALTLAGFLDAAEEMAVDPDALPEPALPEEAPPGDWEGAPPCLPGLVDGGGFGEWQNNGNFAVAVYLKKRYGQVTLEALDAYNRKYFAAPLARGDVGAIAKSVNKKNYEYRCREQPLCAACDRVVCLTRAHGVGKGRGRGAGLEESAIALGEMVKLETDPPTWLWLVDGVRLELSTVQIFEQRKFQMAVIDKLGKWPLGMKAEAWRELVVEKMSRAGVAHVPTDGTRFGQFKAYLEKFCTSKISGRSLDELLMGKPYTENGRTYFCSTDLMKYLVQQKFALSSEGQVYRWLRECGVEHHQKSLKGKTVSYWSIDAFGEQTEPFDVPRRPPEAIM